MSLPQVCGLKQSTGSWGSERPMLGLEFCYCCLEILKELIFALSFHMWNAMKEEECMHMVRGDMHHMHFCHCSFLPSCIQCSWTLLGTEFCWTGNKGKFSEIHKVRLLLLWQSECSCIPERSCFVYKLELTLNIDKWQWNSKKSQNKQEFYPISYSSCCVRQPLMRKMML